MSATAASRSQTPQPEEPQVAGAPDSTPARPPRLIHSEATTEIPIHLLFRDDPGEPGVSLPPAVVRRRQGTGEQPRTARRPAPPVARPLPEVDPSLGERPASVLPGAVGVIGGAAGVAGCAAALCWAGVLPEPVAQAAGLPWSDEYDAYAGLGLAQWASLAGSGALALFGFGGLARGRVGTAWVLTLFGRYRGSVRRTGLMWVNPLLLRRRVDVRLRHWRSEPMPAVDRGGVALRVVVLVVWRVKDAARATLGVADHQEYLRECVEAATARVLSRLPADAFHDDTATLRDADAVGDALTRMLAVEAEPVGIEIFSAQPTRIEYAPEIADTMRLRRVAALDARHRDSVLTSVVDSVEDTVTRLTTRGLVELDDYERKALVKDLTVAFYTGHGDR
ncbi:SPFH domain-containing protein [Streptomyces durmitorensis]|uniref:SPFH domain-containing protein n=1 Tax=Streptomyces durmitorensis TaxID=319947 RepID=A0ABY4PY37_9ACTN|nr:SPFH domain-containing protein [Streptomyces durmitorensis]UQT58370.1 SPFH domain-containing protein [Streptomyces durmitorensis]